MGFKKYYRRSFTLVELMAAMAIIAILAGLGVKGMQFANQAQAEAATKANMVKVDVILENFKKKYGFYPQQSTAGNMNLAPSLKDISGGGYLSSVDDLLTPLIDDYTSQKNSGLFSTSSSDEDGDSSSDDTISAVNFTDGYGANFQYKCPGDNNKLGYDLWSMGADGKDSTADEKLDDITNWE